MYPEQFFQQVQNINFQGAILTGADPEGLSGGANPPLPPAMYKMIKEILKANHAKLSGLTRPRGGGIAHMAPPLHVNEWKAAHNARETAHDVEQKKQQP